MWHLAPHAIQLPAVSRSTVRGGGNPPGSRAGGEELSSPHPPGHDRHRNEGLRLMADGRRPSRREFIHAATAAMAIPWAGTAAAAPVEDDSAGDFILRSQPKPEPRIVLPT